MRINTNVSSLTAQEAAMNTGNNIKSSLEKLSTGLRINKASDDASGLAIADKLRTQATSLGQGISNANSAATLIQIADKAMAEQSNILDTVKAKLIQAATDTTSTDGRKAINSDIKKLLTQLDDIATQTNYNGTNLLNSAQTLTFQVGESAAYDITAITTRASNTTELGGVGSGAVTTIAASGTASVVEGVADTEVILTMTDASEMNGSTIVGKLDSLQVSAVTTTFTANDTATTAVLDGAVGSGLMTETGDVYTFVGTGAMNLGGQDMNLTVNAINADNDTITFGSGSSVTISNTDANSAINVVGANASDNLGTIKATGTLSSTLANSYMTIVDTSLTELNENRAVFGSTQNQLESSIRNMTTTQTNIKAAESVIRDVDYAQESANFNKQNIISQAGSYAISQANSIQQNVLRLLQ